MPTYNGEVGRRPASSGERCVANRSDLESIGRAVGQQVRILRPEDSLALYTVEEASLDGQGFLGMSRAGIRRLGGEDQFAVTVDAQVVNESATDEQAEGMGEFVERLVVGRARKLSVIAPHGGDIERHTDVQAKHVGAKLKAVSPWVWVCKGWSQEGDAFARWHITSTDISPGSFPLLRRMIRAQFAHAVSFHGFDLTRFPGPDIRIGGLADKALKASVRKAIQDRLRKAGKPWEVSVEKPGDRFSGMDPENVVNRLATASGGLQIEQSARARRSMASEIADAVASVYRAVLAAET